MAGINLKITIVTQDLNEVDKIQKKIQKFKNEATKAFAKTGDKVKNVNANVKVLNTGISKLGNRLGFMAFQFTFMAGVAVRALRDIQQQAQQTIEQGAEAQDAIIRAALAADFDITDTTEKNITLLKEYNNAIRDLGSGKTIFGTKEVANVFETVGRALPTLNDQVKTVNATVGISQEVLKLMTIEQVDAKDAAVGFAKILANYRNKVDDVTRITDVLVNVNRQSSAELNELVNSFGFAAQKGAEMGLTIEELGASLGLVHDITPQAGRAFTQLLREFSEESTVFNKQLRNLGVNITDGRNFRNFLDIIKDVAAKTKEIREEFGDEGVIVFQEMFGLDNNAARAFLAMVNNVERLDDLVSGASKKGTANNLADQIRKLSAASNLKALKNSIESLKVDFVIGLLPAVMQITDELKLLVRDKDVQEFFKELGKILAEEVVPVMRFGVGVLKSLAKALKDNKPALQAVVKLFTILVGLMIALFVIGTIGSIMSLMGSVIHRTLIPAIGKLVAEMAILRYATLSTAGASFALLAGIAALGFIAGAFTGKELAKQIEDIFDLTKEEQFNAWVEGIKDDLDDLTKAFIALGPAGAALKFLTDPEFRDETWKSIEDTITSVIDTIDISLRDIATHAGIELSKLGDDISNFFTNELPALIGGENITQLVDSGRFLMSQIWQGIRNFINDSVVFLDPFVSSITESVTGFFEQGKLIGQTIWDGMVEAFGSLFDLIFGTGSGGEGEDNFLAQIAKEFSEFMEEPLQKIAEWGGIIGEQNDELSVLTDSVAQNTDSLNLNKEELDALSSFYNGPLQDATNFTKRGLDVNTTSLGLLQSAWESLRAAVAALEAKIRRTSVSFKRNDDGQITGFNLVGGIDKAEINRLGATAFASGGIVNKPTNAIIGEAGPEAVIPLDRLNEINGGGNHISISVTVQGNATQDTAEEIARQVERIIASKITNKIGVRTR